MDRHTRKVKCWAASLGGCSSKQSREHYVSRVLFDSDRVTVAGFPWHDGASVELPVEALAVNSLCKRHNELLSSVDVVSRSSLDTLRTFALNTWKNRITGSRAPAVVLRHKIDGEGLERWAAKCIVGLVTAQRQSATWRATGSSSLEPPAEVVSAIYGHATFVRPMGLYLTHQKGEPIKSTHALPVMSLKVAGTNQVVGGVILLAGIRFLIWLDREPIGNIRLDDTLSFRPDKDAPVPRPFLVQQRIGERLFQVIRVS